MTATLDKALVWLRRDLRARDNAALYHALRSARRVWCGFVYDRAILDPLPRQDRRVDFIHASLADLDAQLRALCGGETPLAIRHGDAVDEIVRLANALGVQAVWASHDDDPYALERDARAQAALARLGIAFHTLKDHVVFEHGEVLTASGAPYTVFTPYKRAWLAKLEPFYLKAYPVERHAAALTPLPAALRPGLPTLESIGFARTNLAELPLPTGSRGADQLLADFLTRIDAYREARERPAVRGTSLLSVHLRFGTISVRELARHALEHADRGSDGGATWLSELIWRDFYQQILHHRPHVVGHACKPAFDRISWAEGAAADAAFAAWCQGRTGYPLVDAAMAQLNATGFMHNRLRMVSASFLSKDLGIDWRRGEAYFALHLNDFELASNNGGWQWAASTGCDAQPYFRIFNPVTQSQKFDREGAFVRRYLPALAGLAPRWIHAPWLAPATELAAAGVVLGRDYPHPIVDHDAARCETLERFSVVKGAGDAGKKGPR